MVILSKCHEPSLIFHNVAYIVKNWPSRQNMHRLYGDFLSGAMIIGKCIISQATDANCAPGVAKGPDQVFF
jgi:hypothetical protein